MTSIAATTNLPPLGAHQRQEVGLQLQATLLELLDLSLLGKQLHWTIAGPVFHPLHLQLDELVDSWRELADSVAERAMTIGFTPDGQAGAIATGSDIAALERTVHQDHLAVHELTRRVADVSERIRARMDRIGDLDLVSQDLLISVVGTLEQQQWMLRSQFSERS